MNVNSDGSNDVKRQMVQTNRPDIAIMNEPMELRYVEIVRADVMHKNSDWYKRPGLSESYHMIKSFPVVERVVNVPGRTIYCQGVWYSHVWRQQPGHPVREHWMSQVLESPRSRFDLSPRECVGLGLKDNCNMSDGVLRHFMHQEGGKCTHAPRAGTAVGLHEDVST
jgi:hypothetical protein